ncbi:hypothetical protein FACS189497_07000 [Betaproteobacteria bacterium]|nr:hypothetical protein FACS189488_14020 [Betaproteobacteria bacterium]GHU29291.1 hypothetical protein FACS189497_07000 [Betaproteobacteria bacterium]
MPDPSIGKTNPNDSLLSIYKAGCRHSWQADALEFETLARDLEAQYGIKLESVWQDRLTLGELFSHVLPQT